MMLLAFEKWDDMPEYEDPSSSFDGIDAILNKPSTSLQDALNIIRKKDLKIAEQEKKIKELENEVENQKTLVG